MKDPTIKAWIATTTFGLAGVGSFLFVAPDANVLWPDTVFYAVLVLNTFFSVRFFSGILAPSSRQMAVDAVLVVLYVALAYSLGNALIFPLIAAGLFFVAAVKYAVELDSNTYVSVLKRKIGIDFLGAVLCAAALGGAAAGYQLESAWALAVTFTLANLYLLLIRPMYRL